MKLIPNLSQQKVYKHVQYNPYRFVEIVALKINKTRRAEHALMKVNVDYEM